jgi:hypothetical protein
MKMIFIEDQLLGADKLKIKILMDKKLEKIE